MRTLILGGAAVATLALSAPLIAQNWSAAPSTSGLRSRLNDPTVAFNARVSGVSTARPAEAVFATMAANDEACGESEAPPPRRSLAATSPEAATMRRQTPKCQM